MHVDIRRSLPIWHISPFAKKGWGLCSRMQYTSLGFSTLSTREMLFYSKLLSFATFVEIPYEVYVPLFTEAECSKKGKKYNATR